MHGHGSGNPSFPCLCTRPCTASSMKSTDVLARHRRRSTLKACTFTHRLTATAMNLVACGEEPCLFLHRVFPVKRLVLGFSCTAPHEPIDHASASIFLKLELGFNSRSSNSPAYTVVPRTAMSCQLRPIVRTLPPHPLHRKARKARPLRSVRLLSFHW